MICFKCKKPLDVTITSSGYNIIQSICNNCGSYNYIEVLAKEPQKDKLEEYNLGDLQKLLFSLRKKRLQYSKSLIDECIDIENDISTIEHRIYCLLNQKSGSC